MSDQEVRIEENTEHLGEWCWIHHPDIPKSSAWVLAESLDEVWADKGWVKGEHPDGSADSGTPDVPEGDHIVVDLDNLEVLNDGDAPEE